MPRRPRIQLDGVPLHIVQRGYNREPCFFNEEDYASYLNEEGMAWMPTREPGCRRWNRDVGNGKLGFRSNGPAAALTGNARWGDHHNRFKAAARPAKGDRNVQPMAEKEPIHEHVAQQRQQSCEHGTWQVDKSGQAANNSRREQGKP